MKQILQAIGFSALATAIIGGIVVAVSLLDHRVIEQEETEMSEPTTNQPTVSEKVQYLGWEEKNQEFFEDIVEHDKAYKARYCLLYSDGYASFLLPCTAVNDEFDEIVVRPWKVKEQEYVPYEYIVAGGYYINHATGEGWAIRHVDYEYPLIYKKEYDNHFINGEAIKLNE